jgi:DNA mismatch endonuclease, patch repair protein
MADFLTPAERSTRMSRIRSRDTLPEIALRRALHALGLRFRLDNRKLPGTPDIVLPRYKAAVFVHGCFWHRHEGCKVFTTPRSNTAFWVRKFDRNVARDARVTEKLDALGWRVFVVWECELNSGQKASATALALASAIRTGVHS